ncbi:hypothetical protein BDP27DRAFT_1367319 [Rhodocollybia butyracea]|uniref:Uncharacterized protein n=1 Tax=Rhodocollybia butyracea TaxID=206335 RepID=A0A9P5PJ05_9AGAR|nr:hypothetical protein BDP27DRAFT_1367319 [Rhodocollybia butyracea]
MSHPRGNITINLGVGRVGKGVLAMHREKYYYPCRLIARDSRKQRWTIKWWRHNTHKLAGQYEFNVSTSRLLDGLWGNAEARRQVRLGEWKRAYMAQELEDEEELLSKPEQGSYTPAIHDALEPHINILTQLLHQPEDIESDIPAKTWLETQTEIGGIGKSIPFTGTLTLQDLIAVNHWYYKNIKGASTLQHLWIGSIPIGHARTLLVAARQRTLFVDSWESSPEIHSQFVDIDTYVVDRAWELLRVRTGYDKGPGRADVDIEALKILESRNYQWGLDKGIHENNWNPWGEFAPELAIGSKIRDGSPPVRGPNFNLEEESQWIDEKSRVYEAERAEREKQRPLPKPKAAKRAD